MRFLPLFLGKVHTVTTHYVSKRITPRSSTWKDYRHQKGMFPAKRFQLHFLFYLLFGSLLLLGYSCVCVCYEGAHKLWERGMRFAFLLSKRWSFCDLCRRTRAGLCWMLNTMHLKQFNLFCKRHFEESTDKQCGNSDKGSGYDDCETTYSETRNKKFRTVCILQYWKDTLKCGGCDVCFGLGLSCFDIRGCLPLCFDDTFVVTFVRHP